MKVNYYLLLLLLAPAMGLYAMDRSSEGYESDEEAEPTQEQRFVMDLRRIGNDEDLKITRAKYANFDLNTIKKYVDPKTRQNPLLELIHLSNPSAEAIGYLLTDVRIDPNTKDQKGNTALAYELEKIQARENEHYWHKYATSEFPLRILKLLIDHMSLEALNYPDDEGLTPMQRAVYMIGAAPLMEELIKKGVSLPSTIDGRKFALLGQIPLLVAAIKQHDPDKLKVLIENHANLQAGIKDLMGTSLSASQLAGMEPPDEGVKKIRMLLAEALKQKEKLPA